ncbi:hypothetical protein COOONC_18239 [Cooperia oncophora]
MGDSIALYYAPLFFEGIAYNCLFLLSFFMSINRFLLFIFPRAHNKLFTYWGTRIMSLFIWIYVFIFIGLSNLYGCRKQFAKDGSLNSFNNNSQFYFWYNCSNRIPGKFHYNDFMNIQSYFIPAAMITMYLIVYVAIRFSLRGTTKNEFPPKKSSDILYR